MTPSSECFAQFSRQVEQRQKGKVQGRGWFNPIIQVPVVRAKFPRQWNGEGAAIWHRICKQLERQQTCSDRLAQAAKPHWSNEEISFETWEKEAGVIRSNVSSTQLSNTKLRWKQQESNTSCISSNPKKMQRKDFFNGSSKP